MEGLSSPGIGSGLDISGIVNSLVSADIQPKLQSITTKEINLQAKLSGLGQIKSVLSNFQAGLTSISSLASFQSMKTTLSEADIIDVTASNEAKVGNYEVEVVKLAKNHSLASASFTNETDSVGSGVITIEFGTYNATQTSFTANPDKSSQQITINSNTNSLVEIMDIINSSDAGISATIIKDETGARLLFSSDDTGAKNALKITVDDDDNDDIDNAGLSRIIFDPVAGNSHLSQTVAAQDSEVTINGLTVNHHSNILSENITGLSIDLLKASAGDSINVDIAQDTTTAKSKIQIFIGQYNNVMNTIDSLTAYNAETQRGEIFLGDSSIRSLKNQLTNILYTPIDNVSDNFSMIAEIGITTNSNGLLQIDDEKLDEVLANHFDEVGRLFARDGYTSDSLIDVSNVGDDVPSGVYEINLSNINVGLSLDGTINGLSATSEDGHILSGSGLFSALSLKVLGGSTGDRGTITIFDGLSAQFDSLLQNYLGTEGSLESRTDSLESQLDSLTDDREQVAYRAEKLEDTYLQQFNAMDAKLSQLQSLSSFLTQQLATLTAFTNREK